MREADFNSLRVKEVFLLVFLTLSQTAKTVILLVWQCYRCCGRCGLWWKWGAVRLAGQQTPPLVLLCLYPHYRAAAGKVLQQWGATGVVLSAVLPDHWAPTHPTHATVTWVGTARVGHAKCMWSVTVLGSSPPEACHSETSTLSPPACLGKELPWKNPFWSAWSETWQQSWSEEPAFPLALSWTSAETLQFSLQWTELLPKKERKIKLFMYNSFC